jgi:hypothetical protein
LSKSQIVSNTASNFCKRLPKMNHIKIWNTVSDSNVLRIVNKYIQKIIIIQNIILNSRGVI